MSGFKMNPNFERDLKREVQAKLTKVFDRYKGRPVGEVTAALKREGVTPPELSPLAVAISEGREPKVA
ncbi:hypothetical protein [Mycolicibacterium hippocampi]|uniref:hypothetical protein n=1 Tax=Mycolicibacterium hippocampi TaxID=659824 RepID=UPI0035183510